MSKLTVIHSAETYVEEPGGLWSAGLPKRLRDKAFRLVPSGYAHAHMGRPVRDDVENGYMWVRPDGPFLADLEDLKRQHFDGTTPERLLATLDRKGISSAVLYPSVAVKAFSECHETDLLDAFLDVYNDWVLGLSMIAPHRLKGVALLNVDDVSAAAQAMGRLAERGAAGFVLPSTPGEGNRYDQPQYEELWRLAADLQRPLSLLASTGRRRTGARAGGDPTTPRPTLASRLAFKATSVFPVRRSITAITYAGVFERYPALQIGVIGFDAAWAVYAMVRADEMYEVRPERTGPPTRMPLRSDNQSAMLHAEPEQGAAISSDDRSGTRGMALEGVGYYFPPGERFSDHFRRNVFLTFGVDDLGIALRGFLGVDGMLWGQGRGQPYAEDDKPVRDQLDSMLVGASDLVQASDEDWHRLVGGNMARIYGLDPVPGQAAFTT